VVMAKHIRERPDAPRKAAPDRPIPASLERVVLKAMEKEPADRFVDGEEFERALTACGAAVIEAKAASRDRTSGAPRGAMMLRAPLAIGAAIVALAIVITGVVVASAGPSRAALHAVVPDAAGRGADRAVVDRTVVGDLSAATSPSVGPSAAPQVGGAADQDDPSHRGSEVDPGPAAGGPAPASASASASASVAAGATALRHVEIGSQPSGAQIWRHGELVGTTPHSLELATEERGTIELRLAGHESAALELHSAADAQTVTLQPVRRRASRRRGGRAGSRVRVETAEELPREIPSSSSSASSSSSTPTSSQRDPYERFD
jgi:hypothetical protein